MKNQSENSITTIKVVDCLVKINLQIENLNKDCAKAFNIGLNQWLILTEIKNMPGTSAQRLAREIGVHASTLTQSLKRLVNKKWIMIIDDPRDGRRKKIFLTDKGNDILTKTDENRNDIDAMAIKALTWIGEQVKAF